MNELIPVADMVAIDNEKATVGANSYPKTRI